MDDHSKLTGAELDRQWEQRALDGGADFVRFVDIAAILPSGLEAYPRALLFGKALSRDYIRAMKAGQEPKTKEVLNVERRMDALAVKLAAELEAAGYPSVGKLRTGLLPHKTVALRAGLGFIGKNNLLITPEYGCALMLGKVLTAAPFEAHASEPQQPECGDCRVCQELCPTNALLGKTWSVTTTREEIITRKLCTLCLKCMAGCPYTGEYIK